MRRLSTEWRMGRVKPRQQILKLVVLANMLIRISGSDFHDLGSDFE